MDNYNDSYAASQAASHVLSAIIPIYLLVLLITVIGMWKVFTKAGKPGWAAIIPIYNLIVLIEITGKPIWWFLLMFIPCVNFIFGIWIINLVSKSFGQSEGFTIGLVLLPFIFYPVLGFGSYTYLGPAGAPGGLRPFDPSLDYRDPSDPSPQV
jgi:ABC-type sulfate transport system permease subunit